MEKQKYFIQSPSIGTGQVFIDPFTGVTFGIRQINYDNFASGSITFPSSTSEEINNISPGQKWTFQFNNIDFELVLLELNYLYDSYKVQITEK
ncbi:MAG: hypothetical protein AB9846_07290 [Tenuifilaceae bacterium]